MTDSDKQPIRTAWLLWVMAVVTLLGINAVLPDFSSAEKSASPDGIGISQLTDDAQTPGRNTNTLGSLPPNSADAFGYQDSTSLFLFIENHEIQLVAQASGGEVQGRAPPKMKFC